MLKSFDMFEQMFPKLEVTVSEVNCFDKPIIFLDLFSKENIKNKRKTFNQLKFPNNVIDFMEFLQEYTTNESVYKLAKYKDKFKDERDYIDELLRNFVKHKKLDLKFCEKFIEYCNDGFIINGEDLKKQGFKDRAIENEKERIENLRFKSEYYKKK